MGSAGRDSTLAIERQADADGTTRLILRGELDLATCGALHAALRAEERAGAAVVVLHQLDYLDSAGIAELTRARTWTRQREIVALGSGRAHFRR